MHEHKVEVAHVLDEMDGQSEEQEARKQAWAAAAAAHELALDSLSKQVRLLVESLV